MIVTRHGGYEGRKEHPVKYIIEYWLPNQSRLFSEPKCVAVDAKELKKYLAIAKEHNYEIENITQVEEA